MGVAGRQLGRAITRSESGKGCNTSGVVSSDREKDNGWRQRTGTPHVLDYDEKASLIPPLTWFLFHASECFTTSQVLTTSLTFIFLIKLLKTSSLDNWISRSFIRSFDLYFVHSFVSYFIHSSLRLIVLSFVRFFMRACVCSFFWIHPLKASYSHKQNSLNYYSFFQKCASKSTLQTRRKNRINQVCLAKWSTVLSCH